MDNSSQEADHPPDGGESDRGGIVLCFSGGGLRATYFHLGVLRLLRRANLLEKISHICSVSGGSILAAHLVLNWKRYNGTDSEFAEIEKELLLLGGRDIRGRVVRHWILGSLLLLRLLSSRWERQALLEREYRIFLRNATLNDLHDPAGEKRPVLHLLATSFRTGHLCSFTHEGLWLDDGKNSPRLLHAGIIPLSVAVAASSAFPPLFPPVTLSREQLSASNEELPYDPEYLADGGVFDNLGFEKFTRLRAEGQLHATCLFLSDAGARFDWDMKTRFWWIVSRTIRSTDILMKRLADATISNVAPAISGLPTVIFPISDIVPRQAPPKGDLAEDLQKRLPKIRTDLDRFSNDEIGYLVRHGYQVARKRLLDAGDFKQCIAEADDRALGDKPLDSRAIASAATLLDKSQIRRFGLWNGSDFASYALAAYAMAIIACVALFFLWPRLQLELLRDQLIARATQFLQVQQDAYRAILPSDRLASAVLDELKGGPQLLNDLVRNVARRMGVDPSSVEALSRLQIQIVSLIDGRNIGVIASGPNVGRIGILQQSAGVALKIGFATTRQDEKSPDVATQFGSKRGVLTTGTATISTPFANPRAGSRMPTATSDKFLTVSNLTVRREALSELRGRDVLIIIHGYNTTFIDALISVGQVSNEINTQSFPIAFSWPSEGFVSRYLRDEENVVASRPGFTEFIRELDGTYGVRRIDIVAVGLGTRLVLDSLGELANSPASRKRVGQLIFVGPDVDRDFFRSAMPLAGRIAERITIYQVTGDYALTVSQFASANPRAGEARQPLIVTGADTIVVAEPSSFGRNALESSKLLSDLREVLKGTSPSGRGLALVGGRWQLQ